jgi:muramoyltetrapeptide carboxypeptidase LdcA involved in peptidoglycan recycling
MHIDYPPALRAGMRIAVTAPSSGVEPPLHARLDLVLDHLRRQGFAVEEGRCLRAEIRSASASADERAAELMHFMLRNDIDAIIPPWGGELAVELLDRLDWAALQRANPKWLLGYSDTSTLLLPITVRLGWATAHGPCLMDLAPRQSDALTRGTMACLANTEGGSLGQAQSAFWQSKWTDFALVPDCTYTLTEPTCWRVLNGAADETVVFSGRLIGGCLDTLAHTAGTEYGDVRSFIEAAGSDGVILYLENAELSPTEAVRALHRLRWAGWLDSLAGVLVGRSAAPDSVGAHALRYGDAVQSMLGALPCPVLVDVDIGHCPPQMVLINGSLATVRFSTKAGGSVVQRLT